MPTWTTVVTQLERRFTHITHEGPNALRLVLVIAGIRVGVRLRSMSAYGSRVIVLTAELGTSDAVDPWIGLSINQRLVSGALAIEDSILVLRAIVDDDTQIDSRLDLFAREAATMKQEFRPRVQATSYLSHYAD